MKIIFIGEGGAYFSDALKSHGFSPIILPEDEKLPKAVSSHADMLTVNLGGELLFSSGYYKKNEDVLKDFPVILTDEEYGGKYPGDILFNVLFTPTHLYGNLPYISEKIKEFANSNGITPVCVKQGYAKCSVAKINGGYITADTVLHRALTENGEKVLKITEGHFVLPGLNYGFVGGSSFCSDGKLYFFGDISLHPDYEKIKSFCLEFQTEAVSLSSGTPVDIGGAVLL